MQELKPLGESVSEVSYFIPEPRNFAEVTKLSDDINKTWLKSTQKDMKIYNRQSYFSSSISREGWSCDSTNGCIQR